MRKIYALVWAALLAAPLFAQENPLLGMLATHWKTSKEFTLAVAEQMPADSYTFKPNPEQMSFGEQLAHVAGANAYFFSLMTGKPRMDKPANMDKATVMKALADSFDYCAKLLPTLTPEQLHKIYDTPDGKLSGLEIVLFSLEHTTHHRGQIEVYLRVKGIKPADYRF